MNDICPDLEKFKDGWVKGFTTHEVVYAVAMFLIIVGCSGWCMVFAGFGPISTFVGIWISLPVGIQGFYQINGMSFGEVLIRYINLSDNIYYNISDEDRAYPEKQEKSEKGVKDSENISRSKKNYTGFFRRNAKEKGH
jgi:hypothetical protein